MHFDFAEKRFVLEAIVSGSAMSKCGTFFYPNVYARIAAIILAPNMLYSRIRFVWSEVLPENQQHLNIRRC